jgi:hypothetical protein
LCFILRIWQYQNVRPSRLFIVAVLTLAGCETVRQTAIKPIAAPPSAVQKAPARKLAVEKPRAIGVVPDIGFSEPVPVLGVSLTGRSREGDGVSFAGTARKAAKISTVSVPEQQTSLSRLVAWCESHDAEMRDHDPAISSAAGSNRLAEEMRNVATTAWVFFAKKENDNDYHLIIGSTADLETADLMNAEISGLPPRGSRSFPALEDARNQFESLFGDELRSGGYTQFTPTHVLITGSLFYDIDHPAGAVGPRGHAPATAWEIHPITAITPTTD